MKVLTWTSLLLASCAYAAGTVCSSSIYTALAPLAQIPEAKAFCDAKFSPKKRQIRAYSTTTKSITTKSTTTKSTTTTTKPSTTTTTAKPTTTTTTTTNNSKLSSLSSLASNVAKTFCSCYFSTKITTTTTTPAASPTVCSTAQSEYCRNPGNISSGCDCFIGYPNGQAVCYESIECPDNPAGCSTDADCTRGYVCAYDPDDSCGSNNRVCADVTGCLSTRKRSLERSFLSAGKVRGMSKGSDFAEADG